MKNQTVLQDRADERYDALAYHAGWVTWTPDVSAEDHDEVATPLFLTLLKLEAQVKPELAAFFRERTESEGLSW